MRHKNRRYRAVLFDFDGTYADTAPDMIGALNVLRAREQRAPIDFDTARPYVSHGSRALVTLGFEDKSEPEKRELIADFLAAYEQNVAEHTRAFEGIEDWIGQLEQQAIPWGIVTNKPGYLTTAVLSQMPLPYKPHCVIAGDSLIRRKPHPMPVLHAAALIKTAADRCIYIGDARSDITAGLTAGMYTVAAAYGYILPDDDPTTWNADAIVHSVSELRDHINPLLEPDRD